MEEQRQAMLQSELEMKKLQAAYDAMMKEPPAAVAKTSPGISAALRPFVCSGIAAMTASFVIHPIDLAKVRLQLFTVQNPDLPKPNFVKMIGTMAKEEGVQACYAGLSASIARQAIYGTARLALHSIFSDELQRRQGGGAIPFYKK